jgi:hypothetical protein
VGRQAAMHISRTRIDRTSWTLMRQLLPLNSYTVKKHI